MLLTEHIYRVLSVSLDPDTASFSMKYILISIVLCCCRFMKPGESADSPAEPTAKRKFLRPGESSEDQSALSKPAESSNRPSWRKPGKNLRSNALL